MAWRTRWKTKEKGACGGGSWGARSAPLRETGGSYTVHKVTEKYMKSCHNVKVELWSLLVQTVTASTGPKHFQMSANSVTGAGSVCELMILGGGRVNPAGLCKGEKWNGTQMTNTDIKVFAGSRRGSKRVWVRDIKLCVCEKESECVYVCRCSSKLETQTLKCFKFLPSEFFAQRGIF